MKIDDTIFIFPESASRITAKSILEFSLLLDFSKKSYPAYNHNSDSEGNPDFLKAVFSFCHENCSKAFWEIGHDTGFFGVPKNTRSRLSDLFSNLKTPDSLPMFSDLIFHECIMATYHLVMRCLYHEPISEYSLANKLKYYGLAAKKDIFEVKINNDNFKLKVKNFHGPSDDYTYNANAFHAKNESHAKILSPLTTIFHKEELTKIEPCYSDLYYFLCDYNAKAMRSALGIYDLSPKMSINKFSKILAAYMNFLRKLETQIKETANPVDRVYLSYKCEKLFDYNLMSCLIQNLDLLEEYNDSLYGKVRQHSYLCSCFKLPNVFSRHHFTQYAFDVLRLEPASATSYFEFNTMPNGFNHFDERYVFEPARWLEHYNKFCSFMSKLVFPVYEWYFLIVLFESIESKYSTENHYEHLCKIRDLLSEYIRTNECNILAPLNQYTGSRLPPGNRFQEGEVITPDLSSFEKTSSRLTLDLFSTLGKEDFSIGFPHLTKETFKINNDNKRSYSYSTLINVYINSVTLPIE